MSVSTDSLRILQPAPGIFAYYDGRIPGKRLHSASPNWLDDGAYELGLASYAVVDGHEALVYDTHMSLDHARRIRQHLEGLGVRHMRVVLSHWHDDHVAGNEVFADCEIIATARTARYLEDNREKMAAADPPISPLVMPDHLFDDRLDLLVGTRRIELHRFQIHTADGNVLYLPDDRLLLAGDTLEDTITYVNEPREIPTHIAELDRLATLDVDRILPNHGAPDRIAAGGYDRRLIHATQRYLEHLLAGAPAPAVPAPAVPASGQLRDIVGDDIQAGIISYFAPYEAVHQANRQAVERARTG